MKYYKDPSAIKIGQCNVSQHIDQIKFAKSQTYLLTLETDKDSLTIWKFLGWILKLSIWSILLLVINSIIFNTTGNTILGWISSLI